MYSSSPSHGATAYKGIAAHGQVQTADPKQLIHLLLTGAIERIAEARGHLDRKNVARKGEALGRALAIVGELNGSLDLERGGEIAANLRSLYSYIVQRITEANLHNDGPVLDEVSGLLREIRSGWDAICATPAST
jgi:flagellar secretion chaperone FliS